MHSLSLKSSDQLERPPTHTLQLFLFLGSKKHGLKTHPGQLLSSWSSFSSSLDFCVHQVRLDASLRILPGQMGECGENQMRSWGGRNDPQWEVKCTQESSKSSKGVTREDTSKQSMDFWVGPALPAGPCRPPEVTAHSPLPSKLCLLQAIQTPQR